MVITNTVQTVAGDIVVSNKSLSTCPPASDEELLMEMRVRSWGRQAPGEAQSIVTTAATDQSPISGETLDGLEHHRLVILQLLLTLSTTHSTA